jgi:rhodanese-related sulfurtransferase
MKRRDPPARRRARRRPGWLAGAAVLFGAAAVAVWWLADHRRGVGWAVSVVRDRFPDVPQLSPSSLDAWLRDPQRPALQIVDARSEEEFAVSHLPGARRIDPKSTAAIALAALDEERPVVIYCSAGYRGSTLARRLQNAGRPEVWNLEGGIFAWANDGFEIVRDGEKVREVHTFHRAFSRLLRRELRGD